LLKKPLHSSFKQQFIEGGTVDCRDSLYKRKYGIVNTGGITMKQITHFASYGGVFFRKSQAYMKAAFKEFGFSFVEAIVLINVCENPGIIQEKIAYNLALDDAAVARSLKQMESRGLLRREIDPGNQRTKKVHVLPEGCKYKMEMDRIMERWNAILLDGLPEHEIDCIVSALQQLRHRAVDLMWRKHCRTHICEKRRHSRIAHDMQPDAPRLNCGSDFSDARFLPSYQKQSSLIHKSSNC
jgi:DNA-binding MarR family transcriptional regulator